MLRYTIKRFISMIITLFMIITITFFMMHAIPGDPFALDRETPPVIKENLNKKYGLDKSVPEQYVIYLQNLAKGNLGESMVYKGQTANQKIANGIGASATIGFGGIIVGVTVGCLLGICAALHRGKKIDVMIIILAIVGVSVPSFVYGSLFQFIFGVKLKVLPVLGWGSAIALIAPIMAASLTNIAFFSRMLRTSMLDVMNQDYVLTAQSKGLNGREVISRHVLRNSMMPLVTAIGPMMAGALTGSFVIEKIFNIPGIGQHMIIAIQNNDYFMIMGLTIFSAGISIVLIFAVDILYGLIDPRIRIER